MFKRIYFENGKKVTKKSKTWVEVEMDFAQVYDCFSEVAMRIKSISSCRLLFWLLLKEMVKGNVVYSNIAVYKRFRQYLEDNKCDLVSGRTFQNCFKELADLRILVRTSRGCYYLNPHFFWRAGKLNRKDFIEAEAREGRLTDNVFIPELMDSVELQAAFRHAQENATSPSIIDAAEAFQNKKGFLLHIPEKIVPHAIVKQDDDHSVEGNVSVLHGAFKRAQEKGKISAGK